MNLYYYLRFERTFLRHDKEVNRFFLKSLKKGEEYERPIDNDLVSRVRIYGLKISKDDYIKGEDIIDPR